MARRFLRCLALLLPAALWLAETRAEWQPPPEEIREDRQSSLDDILTSDPAERVADFRRNCVVGAQPAWTTKQRTQFNAWSLPDAADFCVMVLIRTGRDGRLLDVYEDILRRHTGATANVEKLPAWIGGALIEQHSNSVPVGNGKGAVIEPALAFDAGFATAYLEGQKTAPGMPSVADLKAISERCLAQTESNLGLCYATGYAHAVRALNGLLPKVDPVTASQ